MHAGDEFGRDVRPRFWVPLLKFCHLHPEPTMLVLGLLDQAVLLAYRPQTNEDNFYDSIKRQSSIGL